jgi:cell wall-associated NlpC family hydrolase
VSAPFADSIVQGVMPNRTTSTGLVTYTAGNQLNDLATQLRNVMANPSSVTGKAPDPAPAADATTAAGPGGIPNPWGMGITAYEPNTSPYIHAIADSKTGFGSPTLQTVSDDYASAQDDVIKSEQATLNVAAANGVSDYSTGGVTQANGKVQAFVNAALAAASRGLPYVWGGTSLSSGVDCSGLIYAAAQAAGIDWKRYVSADYGKMPAVSAAQARPGDIVYYAPSGQAGVGSTGHVGIYLGNGKMVAAPQSGQNVKVESVFGTPTFHRIFNDEQFGTVTTPTGGTTYNYNGRTWNAQASSAVLGLPAETRPFRNDSQQSAWLASGGAEMATASYTAPSSTLKVNVPYANLFTAAGQKYGISPALLAAVARQESGFNPTIRSSAGAIGLMQFMPATAAGLGVNPLDPASAVDGAARMLTGLYRQFGRWDYALAAYNAGAGAVLRYGGIPPYAETQRYVTNVSAIAQQYGG